MLTVKRCLSEAADCQMSSRWFCLAWANFRRSSDNSSSSGGSECVGGAGRGAVCGLLRRRRKVSMTGFWGLSSSRGTKKLGGKAGRGVVFWSASSDWASNRSGSVEANTECRCIASLLSGEVALASGGMEGGDPRCCSGYGCGSPARPTHR